ncbi:TPA: relaxase/mobilization nuclease domain-containing protein [Legionella pneumophila]|uniref:TraI/MobA(P) family conjugative relaxase n=1 Tax=Legionella pneumophila TaxID=446 RepID=UPI00077C9B32|nr:TraI/MobA(P) family conjugative relaxase [Legionella pneumophila]AMQ26649.1 conjugal transfer protein TraI [Legionella pneumophila subsp. pneumophila]PQM73309.1 conjugal transfer protein TraI [Legionella pneumophila]HAT3844128.1 relaxase/mobilization nuclease domain-containing protein [Legionella pneumophila]HAU0263374.1 relaxase/mobilization nuclease domain-containing protein [Legionella pneumophila]HAU0297906.1 relaxase/mobilization nuclease domain-containing protein [Legionella pneumophi
MIIRHIPMKSAKLSNFSSLVKYIVDEQNKHERVGKVRISNCNSIDPTWAIHEVLATQARNQRAKGDKTYHLLISFAPGENPSEDILKAIEERVVSSIGFKDHQRISAIHHDTDNLHIHVAVNKIHPKSFNMIEPYRAYRAFSEVASTLEVEYGLELTNHQTRKSRSENLADDMEQHSGIESLINWMKRQCWENLESAENWDEFHKILAVHDLEIRVKANGFVFCNKDGLTIKASSVSRGFSKKNLEYQLGAFIPSPYSTHIAGQNIYRYEPLNKQVLGKEIYARYLHEKEHGKTVLSEKLESLCEVKTKLIDKAKKRGRMKRAALKLLKATRTQKQYLYKQISQTLLNDIEKIRKNYTKERDNLLDSHKKNTWADWLRYKAQQGDKDALTAMRYRNRKNKTNYTLSGQSPDIFSADIGQVDSITKEGTEIYKAGKAVIRNTGKEIQISKGGSIAALQKAIEMARQRYGSYIHVSGSPLFKKIIVQLTVQNNIPITFADPEMESQRQKMTSQLEKQNEQSRRYGFDNGRRTARSNEVAGKAHREGSLSRKKPNAFSTRQGPPAKGQNSLRDMSQLDMVQLTGRGKVLLPADAYDQLERQRLQPDNHVRRKTFGLKRKSKQVRE